MHLIAARMIEDLRTLVANSPSHMSAADFADASVRKSGGETNVHFADLKHCRS